MEHDKDTTYVYSLRLRLFAIIAWDWLEECTQAIEELSYHRWGKSLLVDECKQAFAYFHSI